MSLLRKIWTKLKSLTPLQLAWLKLGCIIIGIQLLLTSCFH